MLRNDGRVRRGAERLAPRVEWLGYSDDPVTCVVRGFGKDGNDSELFALRHWQLSPHIDVEGSDWCYGWDGPAVDALRAATVLA